MNFVFSWLTNNSVNLYKIFLNNLQLGMILSALKLFLLFYPDSIPFISSLYLGLLVLECQLHLGVNTYSHKIFNYFFFVCIICIIWLYNIWMKILVLFSSWCKLYSIMETAKWCSCLFYQPQHVFICSYITKKGLFHTSVL